MQGRYLYRAKRLDNGEWVYGDLVHSVYKKDDSCVGQYGNEIGMHTVDPSTICQCTGLKDKNGKVIWENDILKAHLDDKYPEDITYERVVWHNGRFCTIEKGSKDLFDLDEFDKEYYEICGNVFDDFEGILGQMQIKRCEAVEMAVKALEEVQQYREIGKVSTCRDAVDICRAMIERGIEPENIKE